MEHSIESLFQEYHESCDRENKLAVSQDKFRRIITEDFNLSFKGPKSDTCHLCDKCSVSLNEASPVGDQSKVAAIKKEQEIH